MLLTDRNFNTSFLTLQVEETLFISTFILVFWTSRSYILILPGFGIVSQVICCFPENLFLGIQVWFMLCIYRYFRFCCLGASHVYSWLDVDTRAYFTAATMIIAIPTGLKFLVGFQQYEQVIYVKNSIYFYIRFLVLFTIGGLTGLCYQMLD